MMYYLDLIVLGVSIYLNLVTNLIFGIEKYGALCLACYFRVVFAPPFIIKARPFIVKAPPFIVRPFVVKTAPFIYYLFLCQAIIVKAQIHGFKARPSITNILIQSPTILIQSPTILIQSSAILIQS